MEIRANSMKNQENAGRLIRNYGIQVISLQSFITIRANFQPPPPFPPRKHQPRTPVHSRYLRLPLSKEHVRITTLFIWSLL